MFEEFLFTWQDRLRKLEQPTAVSVKLQGEVDKYKVHPKRVDGIIYHCLLFSLSIYVLMFYVCIRKQVYMSRAKPLSRA